MSAPAYISEFLNWAVPHALRMSNVLKYLPQINTKDQWGYRLGAVWELARSGQWAGHYVTDCNGLAEAFLGMDLGGNHNTFSRVNFSTWCKGFNGTDMTQMPQQPGTAIFHMGATFIEHVGFLYKKIGPGRFDWLVLEAANSSKGVIISLFGKQWNRWGQMRSKFVYDIPESTWKCTYTEPAAIALPLRLGMAGANIRWLQWNLEYKGFICGGVDGDFGPKTQSAVIALQKSVGLCQTGVADAITVAALKQARYFHAWRCPYKEPAASALPQAGQTNASVGWLQWHLELRGYPLVSGGIDSTFGSETSAAVRAAEKAYGLPIGPVTSDLVKALKAA